MADYVPRIDAMLVFWLNSIVAYIVANQAVLGVSVGQVAELVARHTAWNTVWDAHLAAAIAAQEATEAKEGARDSVVDYIRMLVKIIQANEATTDPMREAMQITIADTTPTELGEQVVLLTPPPVIEVVCHAPQATTVKWHPADGTESDALPQGIDGIVIHVAVKAGDGSIGPFQWIGIDTNSPYVHSVGNSVSVTNVYKAQWYDRRQRFGPFGDAVEVAVTAS